MPSVDNDIHEQLKRLPEVNGVYLMKNEKRQVIYVGKARSLKGRVSSYFQDSKEHSPKIKMLVSNIRFIDFVTTENEMEALILECNLIKKYRPYYNSRLKDDKKYPMLEVTLDEEFPRIQIVRKASGKNTRIFGPFTNSNALRKIIIILKKVFNIRICKDKQPLLRKRPCLNYQIKQCCAPCKGLIKREEYLERVNDAMLFISGHCGTLLKKLYHDMEKESQNLNFEKCSLLLSNIKSIEEIIQKQKVVFLESLDRDYIAFYSENHIVCAEVLIIRDGKLIEEKNFIIQNPEENSNISDFFLMQYYQKGSIVPSHIYIDELPVEKELIEKWLSQISVRKITLKANPKGKNKDLLSLARQNAYHHFKWSIKESEKQTSRMNEALKELKAVLNLREIPGRIEAYDISNLSGKYATGSMVVFSNGKPDKEEYRKFRIRGKDTPDDITMMKEMLERRFSFDSEQISGVESDKKDEWKKNMPDLIVIDGGKAQLKAVLNVINKKGISIPVISLAKKNEEIYSLLFNKPKILPFDSLALKLLVHLRDETHRFAVKYHRHLITKGFIGKDD